MKRLAIVALIGLMACGNDSSAGVGPKATASGTWSGTMHGSDVEGITLTMTIVESNGTVTGSANLGGTNVPKALTLTGTWAAPTLSVTLTEGGLHPPSNLTGTITGNTLTASLNGSGFTNDAITMTR
jgi:hypothetical protein